MSTHIHVPFKSHVTSVTRVTASAKHPDSLAFPLVTRINSFQYTACNASETCNRQRILRSLLASTPTAYRAGMTLRLWGLGQPNG